MYLYKYLYKYGPDDQAIIQQAPYVKVINWNASLPIKFSVDYLPAGQTISQTKPSELLSGGVWGPSKTVPLNTGDRIDRVLIEVQPSGAGLKYWTFNPRTTAPACYEVTGSLYWNADAKQISC